MQDLTGILDKILDAVANGKHRHPDQKLAAFYPVKGEKSVGELMIVGRAPNQWQEPGWRAQDASDSQTRKNIIHEVLPEVFARGTCPLVWISKWWGKTGGFSCPDCGAEDPPKNQHCSRCQKDRVFKIPNTAKSAFFRVMRSITGRLKIADISTLEWASYLMWTDLYKIAPSEGGNPDSSLQKMQRELCIEMLTQEIQQWRPRRILFLTGSDWAGPFLSGIGVLDGEKLDGTVDYVGRIPLGSSTATVVVAPHPQGKKEQPIVNEIVSAFENHGACLPTIDLP